MNNQEKLITLYNELNINDVDNLNICGVYHFKDDLHLLKSGKRLLVNNIIFNFNNFLSETRQPNPHI